MTEPAITGVAVTGGCVFAATTDDCLHNALIGSWADVEGNLRAWVLMAAQKRRNLANTRCGG